MRNLTKMKKAFLRGLLRRANAYEDGKLQAFAMNLRPEERFFVDWYRSLRDHRQVKRLIAEDYIKPVYQNGSDVYEILKTPFEIHED